MSTPRTAREHIEQNREEVEAEILAYAHDYGVSLEKARLDVEGEWAFAFEEAMSEARHEGARS